MKVLVDTSAWADFLNEYPSGEGEAVGQLIAGDDELCTCGLVVAEVFQGLRRTRGREELEGLFRKLLFLEPIGSDLYFRAAELYRRLRERGLTVRSTIDCLLAVLAEHNDCFVLARDRDLEMIMASGLVQTRLFK